jgi:hypothetical protein
MYQELPIESAALRLGYLVNTALSSFEIINYFFEFLYLLLKFLPLFAIPQSLGHVFQFVLFLLPYFVNLLAEIGDFSAEPL